MTSADATSGPGSAEPGATGPAWDDLEEGSDPRGLRRRTRLYGATTGFLTAIMLLSLADAVDLLDAWGVDDHVAVGEADGYELAVRHPTVTRGGLASPFEVTVTHAGGFATPLQLAVDDQYFRLWDENGMSPVPTGEWIDGDWIVMEFDPPTGDEFRMSFDARIEPAVQRGRGGEVELRIDGDRVVAVDFRTEVRP